MADVALGRTIESPGAIRRKDICSQRTWCLAALVLVGGILRSVTLTESLWLDELHTSWVVAGDLRFVASRAAEGNQAPIFYWLVWCASRVFGPSEPVLRLLSWSCGTLLIYATGSCALRWGRDKSLAMLAAGLIMLDPHGVYFSREARPYSMAQLLTLWQIEFFWSLLMIPRRGTMGTVASARCALFARWPSMIDSLTGRWFAWMSVSVVLFYTHYLTWLILPVELVWLLGTRHGRRAFRYRGAMFWLTSALYLLLASIPAWSSLSAVAARRENWWQFVGHPDLASVWTLFPWIPYWLAPPVLVAALRWIGPRAAKGPEWRAAKRWVMLAAPWYFVPVGIAWVATRWGLAAIFLRRYLMISAAGLMMLVAAWGTLLAARRPRQVFAITLLLLIGLYYGQSASETWGTHSREQWREAIADWNSETAGSHLPLVLSAGLIEERGLSRLADERLATYCRFPLLGLYRLQDEHAAVLLLPRDGRLLWTDEEWKILLESARFGFLVRGLPETIDSLLIALDRGFAERGWQLVIRSREDFGLVHLIVLSPIAIDDDRRSG